MVPCRGRAHDRIEEVVEDRGARGGGGIRLGLERQGHGWVGGGGLGGVRVRVMDVGLMRQGRVLMVVVVMVMVLSLLDRLDLLALPPAEAELGLVLAAGLTQRHAPCAGPCAGA